LSSLNHTYNQIVNFIRKLYDSPDESIPLHEPRFYGNEKKYVMDAIDSTFVSSVGAYVDRFEKMMTELTGAKFAVATVNGTSALHTALILAGVEPGDEVITQPLTFVATANAIAYTGAKPIFTDIDKSTLGLCPDKLNDFLEENLKQHKNLWVNKKTGKKIAACVPMHTFGHPAKIDKIVEVCSQFDISVVEDAAESLGSTYKGKQTGTFGLMGTYSFNGNKTITCGGGGAIVTDNVEIAKRAKHLTTTAKKPHKWDYVHDETGYNYRMPNLNAAMACTQLEMLEEFLQNKRELAKKYHEFFSNSDIKFFTEPEHSKSNYWLNTIQLKDKSERDAFLEYSNNHGVMTRPAWRLMHKLDMYTNCQTGDLENAERIEQKIVNIPSSVREK